MKTSRKIFTGAVCTALLVSAIPGCAAKTNKVVPPKVTITEYDIPADTEIPYVPGTETVTEETGSSETAESEESDQGGTNSPADTGKEDSATDNTDGSTDKGDAATDGSDSDNPDKDTQSSELKDIYRPTEDVAESLKNEETRSPIVYTGFEFKFVETPVISDKVSVIGITPVFNHTQLHKYAEENSSKFDLGSNDGSFKEASDGYSDEYFLESSVLIVSFLDSEGGANYEVTGAWEEVDINGMNRIVFTVKKTDGSVKAGHLFIEMNSDFMAAWDTYGVEFYK